MKYPLSKMPFRPVDAWIVVVASMEQIIGAGLSTVVGIMLPMMQLMANSALPSWLQGLVGATGLVGIGVGSVIIGKMSDSQGYLAWFRACPIIISLGSLICLIPGTGWLIAGLFICGIGVGGGYSLDSAYISELLPEKWRAFMVGVAKSSSSLGFIVVAIICYFVLKAHPDPAIWRLLMLIMTGLGVLTFLMRIRWAESPAWLLDHGKHDAAQAAAEKFLGPDVEVLALASTESSAGNKGWGFLFKGKNLLRVIYSGIPWACEGLGVYGFGVFLPILVMALGIESSSAEGMHKVIGSVETTALVNFFILPGFIIGLFIMNKVNHVAMLWVGFVMSAIGLIMLYFGFTLHMAKWVMILGFIIFEIFLNAGPHLITFVIPTHIYPVNDRGAGAGLAALLGKVGAVGGVVIMPILLHAGGVKLVLIVSTAVMLLGALIGYVFGKLLKLT